MSRRGWQIAFVCIYLGVGCISVLTSLPEHRWLCLAIGSGLFAITLIIGPRIRPEASKLRGKQRYLLLASLDAALGALFLVKFAAGGKGMNGVLGFALLAGGVLYLTLYRIARETNSVGLNV